MITGIVHLTSVTVGRYYVGNAATYYQDGQMFGRSGSSYGQSYTTCEPASIAYGNQARAYSSSYAGSVPTVKDGSRINIIRMESS